jgi:hypothetical protein
VCTIRGIAIIDTGRYEEGIQELERAVTIAPIEADPHNAAYALSMLGKAHLLRGDTPTPTKASETGLPATT